MPNAQDKNWLEPTPGDIIRWTGLIILLVAVYCRMHVRMILPSSFAWSGDFRSSEWGELVSGFADLCNVFMLLGGGAFLLSFTTLVRERE